MTLNILEQFAPLLGVDLTLSNNMSVKLEIKKDRNISLSLANNQITEIKGSEIKFGSGYTWRKLSLPLKIAGKTLDPSDLRMRLDVSIRDNKTIINVHPEYEDCSAIALKFNQPLTTIQKIALESFYSIS